MAGGPKLNQDELKEMVFKEIRSRGYQFSNRNRGTMVKSGEEEPEGLAPYEVPPANGECLILTRLTSGKYSSLPTSSSLL
jgi:hypothetical protein